MLNPRVAKLEESSGQRAGSKDRLNNYLEAESLFNIAIASCTVVINCAGKMMVEFFSVAISAIVCSVRS